MSTWGTCDKCNRVLLAADLPRCPECVAEFGRLVDVSRADEPPNSAFVEAFDPPGPFDPPEPVTKRKAKD